MEDDFYAKMRRQFEKAGVVFATKRLGFVMLDTPEKAAEIVALMIEMRFGQQAVAEEKPFIVTDNGDTWTVKGSRFGTYAFPLPLPVKTVVVIQKEDCQIVSWNYKGQVYPKDTDLGPDQA